MPEVDFMILCDHVRPEGPILHIIAAGIDRIEAASFPTVHNMGIAIRLLLTRAECDEEPSLELRFSDQDGRRLVGFNGKFQAKYPDNVPPGWHAYGVMPINMGLPLPAPGIYS